MILVNSIQSLIESLYLNIEPCSQLSLSSIIVNPTNVFLVNKTIIINHPNYNQESIKKLYRNNIVISRFPIEFCHQVIPYDLNFKNIITTGRVINKKLNIDTLNSSRVYYDPLGDKTYIDSFLDYEDTEVMDFKTVIGYIKSNN